MALSNWHESTLRQYYPSYLGKKYFNKILKIFKNWEPTFKKELRAEQALNRVRVLKSNRDIEELIHHILAVCFFAREYEKLISTNYSSII